MERYEAYKDSGVEWIGEIPECWDIRRIKGSCAVVAGATPKSDSSDYWNGSIPWITPADYSEEQHYVAGGSRFITKQGLDSCGTVLVPEGSVIVSNRAPIGLVSIASRPLCTNQGCKAIIPVDDCVSSEYLYWYLLTQSESLNSLGRGTTFLELSTQSLSDFSFPCPSRDEQGVISEFLDVEVAKIDGLVADCEREVELLQEYRKAVISEAVTKGLDPNVPMKDSGVEWIGRIPEGWSILYPKKLFALRKERAYPNDVQLTASQKNGIVTQNEYMRLENQRVVQVITGNDILKHVEAGDFVISMRSFQGGLEYSTICGKISSAYVMLYAIDRSFICDEYYKYLFKSDEYIQALQSTSNLVRDGQALRFSNFVQVYLPVPSVAEQQRIAQYLSIKTAEIDSLIEMKQQMADKLREYRKSLISEAVTGKFKVPGVD